MKNPVGTRNNSLVDTLVGHYENCFEKHGPSPRGVDWPKEDDALKRYKVMMELWRDHSQDDYIKILDIGCGYGALAQALKNQGSLSSYSYTGVDLSEPMLEWASKNFPDHQFTKRDIIENPLKPLSFDYGVMNGVLTEKLGFSFNEMETFAQEMILSLYKTCRYGIAFNVMSSHVDWQRDDLFHLPLDRVVDFLVKNCSRHLVIRQDYGLYEYTIYLYRYPRMA